jgi:hypothetical protein
MNSHEDQSGLNFLYMNEIAERCSGQPFCTAGLRRVADSPFALAGGYCCPNGMAAADLDNDGDQDIIVGVKDADDLTFLNDGNGNFQIILNPQNPLYVTLVSFSTCLARSRDRQPRSGTFEPAGDGGGPPPRLDL